MKNKWTLGFLFRFAVVFGLLIAPWPGWNEAYSQYFRAFGQWAFNSNDGGRLVVFAPIDPPLESMLDTKLSLGNRALMDTDGKGLIKRTRIDTRSIGWLPTALTIALVAATPVPWFRRLMALATGLVLVHVFIFFSLQTWIWNSSPDVALFTLSRFWKTVTDELAYACMNQLGISFTVPVLIWILVTFKRQDARIA
jgi:hypothetical protein